MKSLTLLNLMFISASAIASGEYEFCVDRTSNSTHEVLHAKFNYGDIDPGKEAARILVSQRYKKQIQHLLLLQITTVSYAMPQERTL